MLRSELFSIEQLKRHAITLASQHQIDPDAGPDKLLPRLADNERVLLAAYDVVTAASGPERRIVAAESWLLDNFYLIEQQINLARRHLPRGYSRQLPRLASGPSAGYPRIYDLALELISHRDGRVDHDNAIQFIEAYQTVTPLQLGELWAFPIMLQLALLENLRRVGLRIARRREDIDAAVDWADRMLETAEREPKQLIQLLAAFAKADVPMTAPFVEEFYARLQAQAPAMTFVQTWVDQKLIEQGVTAAQLSEVAGRIDATNQISIANSIGSLRFISAMNWQDYVESLSVVEQILREDPAGLHASQDFPTRDRYRHVIEDIARDSVHSEASAAREAIALAQTAANKHGTQHRTAHVGYYLIDAGRMVLERNVGYRRSWSLRARRTGRRFALACYLLPILLLTGLASAAMLSAFAGFAATDWRVWLFGISSVIGTSALAVALVNLFVTLTLPPRVLPRLDFSRGIPDDHRTMVVVPTLLTRMEDVDTLLEALEIRYLGNRDPNLFYALLTDFPDAPQETMPDDDAVLAYARAAVQALNDNYRDDRPDIFYLFHRPRVWNPVDRVWMGYERKRGKLEQFNALLRGGAKTAFSEIVGDPGRLETIRYVITLDTDTQLPRDAAYTLIGNLAHPLNRPVFDRERGRIIEGYAILQPRTSISLTSAGQSRFSRLFAGESGIDPYTREVSDVYQDLFGEGSFVGKGIYDVDAFRQAVDGRFPENLILSHDLLESGYARSALVTDVDLIEEHPASYAAEASRRHRWIRGDWQLAGWLLPRVPNSPRTRARQPNPLSALSWWKILDNMRRSLVAPALLILLVGGWLMGPGFAGMWTLSVIGILALPGLLGMLIDLARKPNERDWMVHLSLVGKSAVRPLAHAVLTLIFLPYDTLICLDAIARSGLKMLFTRRGLLLWQTPGYARRNARKSLGGFLREMWIAPVFAAALLLILADVAPPGPDSVGQWLVWSPLLLLWLVAPAVGWSISMPLASPAPNLTEEQRQFLRASARRTWRYFVDFVNENENWLPPDNFQEHPAPVIAARTSPTNIGMALLSNLAAYDFGYLTAGELLHRTENTLDSMNKLERYRGHLYNWYDTRTLAPLHPRYVSSVDSGNLAGCLLTLQAGLLELKDKPVLPSAAFQGLEDTLQLLVDHLPAAPAPELAQSIQSLQKSLAGLPAADPPQTPAEIGRLLDMIDQSAESLVAMLPADCDIDGELYYWARAFDEQIQALREELRLLLPEPAGLSHIPALSELVSPLRAHGETSDGGGPARQAAERIALIDALIERCRQMIVMDFDFLYDASRGLLAIGYDVSERRRDPSCYDLLASEARLASFMIIAQGQVPQKHWFSLGRLLTSHAGEVALISWSGSMFEYLMPQLIMPSYDNTLLEETCKAAVMRQIEYGRQRTVPWGISESCYNATDNQQIYQYRAFGVPGLGFKRGLGDDLVIAPYASALALMVLPHDACRNLQALADHGFMGRYGFYEAIDYTPSRVPRGKQHAVVRSFMVHHQGMSLLSLAHVLLDQPMQRRFMSDPLTRATALLLQERIPKKGATLHPHAAEVSAAARPAVEGGNTMRVFTDPNTLLPEVHLLSNGSYHVMATHAGGGYSCWNGTAITRWREDATSDDWGTFIYLRDRDSGRYWSSAYQPTGRKADHYEAIFVQARAEYRRRDHAIETHTEVTVSPEDDVEIRRVTLTNHSSRQRRIELTSYAEVVLAPLAADLAHRAFSNLFVQTEILHACHAILCTRRPRTAGEQVPWMFHVLAAPDAMGDTPSFETDRSRFVGRGRSAARPVVMETPGRPGLDAQPLSNTDGPVLDPIVSIRRTFTIGTDQAIHVNIISGIAESREEALALLEKYCDRHFVERAFEMA
ncbi:MAG: cyclic beta 1-2 glucan synthetase, partial [Thiobacillus sp.]|nr:cyclic beta 1-2 glucan synthetase [Thiobacillus sp.]